MGVIDMGCGERERGVFISAGGVSTNAGIGGTGGGAKEIVGLGGGER